MNHNQRPDIKEFLDSNIIDYELDDGYINLLSEDFEDFYAILDIELFNKEVFDSPPWSNDPIDIISIGEHNIEALGRLDRYYRDEWEISDIGEVFYKNIKRAKVEYA